MKTMGKKHSLKPWETIEFTVLSLVSCFLCFPAVHPNTYSYKIHVFFILMFYICIPILFFQNIYIYKSCVPKEGPREGLSIISFEGFALYYAGVGQNSQHMPANEIQRITSWFGYWLSGLRAMNMTFLLVIAFLHLINLRSISVSS